MEKTKENWSDPNGWNGWLLQTKGEDGRTPWEGDFIYRAPRLDFGSFGPFARD